MRRICLFILFLLLGCYPADIQLNGGFLEHKGSVAHWDASDFPLTVLIDSSLSTPQINAIYAGIEYWNNELTRDVFSVQLYDFSDPTTCGFVAVTVEDVHEDPYSQPDKVLAFCRPGYRKNVSRLCNALIVIDAQVPLGWLRAVTIHEFGHALGLAHDKNDNRSIMYPTINVDIPRFIMPDDVYYLRKMIDGEFEEVRFSSCLFHNNPHLKVLCET